MYNVQFFMANADVFIVAVYRTHRVVLHTGKCPEKTEPANERETNREI